MFYTTQNNLTHMSDTLCKQETHPHSVSQRNHSLFVLSLIMEIIIVALTNPGSPNIFVLLFLIGTEMLIASWKMSSIYMKMSVPTKIDIYMTQNQSLKSFWEFFHKLCMSYE